MDTIKFETFGEKLKYYRKKSGLTQGELSEMLGLADYKPISHWENNLHKPNKTNVNKLHNILNMPF